MFRTKVLLGGAYCENFVTHTVIAPAFYTILTLDFPFTGPAAIGPEAFARLNLN